MKDYRFEIRIKKETEKGFTTTERKARLCIDDDFTLKSVLTFEKDFKKALSAIKKAVKSNSYVEARLLISTYDGWHDETRKLTQKSFDCWQYNGYLHDINGLYLPADTQYTDSSLDIWIDYHRPIESIMDK